MEEQPTAEEAFRLLHFLWRERVGEWESGGERERVCVCELVVCELGDFQNVHVHRGQPPSNYLSPGLRLRCSTGNLTGAALPVL